MGNGNIICNKCESENCANNESCIVCGKSALNGSMLDINTRIAINFLREKNVLGNNKTSFIISYPDGSAINVVKLMAELLTRRERDTI